MSQTQAGASGKPRYDFLDISKGFAIMSVVILHLCSQQWLADMFAPWHIWQAMPIFLFVAGFTCNLVWKKYKGDVKAYYKDLPSKIWGLYLPYAVVIVIYHIIEWQQQPLTLELFIQTLFMGYLGPGGYFVPLIVLHLTFFPLFLMFRERLRSDLAFLGWMFVISAALELLFAFADVPSTSFLYRIYYFRYLFACSLGAVVIDNNPFTRTQWKWLVIMSVVYMFAVTDKSQVLLWIFGGIGSLSDGLAALMSAFSHRWDMVLIRHDSWFFQHYPAFFYTAFLVLLVRDHVQNVSFAYAAKAVEFVRRTGRISYDIFIVQLLFFITLYKYFNSMLVLKLVFFCMCLGGGYALAMAKSKWKVWKKSKTASS